MLLVLSSLFYFFMLHPVSLRLLKTTNIGKDDILYQLKRKVGKDIIQANVNWY